MRLLLDTHILLWAAANTLPKEALPYFLDEKNILLFSSASIWEVVIKNGLHRPDFNIDPLLLYEGLMDNGYQELSVTSRHTLQVGTLPSIHRDPFDRILIAQAQMEGVPLLTADSTVARYAKTIILIGTK